MAVVKRHSMPVIVSRVNSPSRRERSRELRLVTSVKTFSRLVLSFMMSGEQV
jgi:hypothetical protein